MTGAKIPEGANCVIMIEHTSVQAENRIVFTGKDTKANICIKGEDVRTGEIVLHKGSVINPASIAVAASVGKTTVRICKPPRIGLLATGDELVEMHEKPEGAAIRNSNSYNLMAQISQTPASICYYGIIPDTKEALDKSISKALNENDIVIITGGVSMGDKDFIPELLKAHGLATLYEKLAIQPGKPTVFAYGDNKFCFGLSGNPVSSLLQFELVTRPFIYHFMQNDYNLPIVKTRLKGMKQRKKTERIQFFPVQFSNGIAELIEFHGSAHIAGLSGADGFGFFETGMDKISNGDEIEVLLLQQ
jgi:molybdopterin molybdotransferase